VRNVGKEIKMTNGTYSLGGRLPLLEPDDLSGVAKALYQRIVEAVVPDASMDGFCSIDEEKHLIGPFNAALYSPEICGSFLELQKSETEKTSLSTQERQIVILSVGSVWKSAYELYAHTAAAKAVGLTPQQVDALAKGQPVENLSPQSQLAQIFTLELVSRHVVSSKTYAEARQTFGDRGLVEMVTLIGCYLSVCALLNAFEVPAPATPQTQEANHG
jgi:4-carboxymuconolactone decarboxylase